MTQAQGIQTFDQSVAAGLGPDVALELPADQQYRGTLWPNPADNISNHSAEGAPWVPAAGTMNQPYDANKNTGGVNPLSYSVHDGYVLPFNAGVVRDARTGVEVRGPLNTGPHAADLVETSGSPTGNRALQVTGNGQVPFWVDFDGTIHLGVWNANTSDIARLFTTLAGLNLTGQGAGNGTLILGSATGGVNTGAAASVLTPTLGAAAQLSDTTR